MRLKSRTDLLHQIVRMAERDYELNGTIWYCGESESNTDRCNKVWRIFRRYQKNIVVHFGREWCDNALNLTTEQYFEKLPRSVYAGF